MKRTNEYVEDHIKMYSNQGNLIVGRDEQLGEIIAPPMTLSELEEEVTGDCRDRLKRIISRCNEQRLGRPKSVGRGSETTPARRQFTGFDVDAYRKCNLVSRGGQSTASRRSRSSMDLLSTRPVTYSDAFRTQFSAESMAKHSNFNDNWQRKSLYKDSTPKKNTCNSLAMKETF